ncbi:hypothetical protein PENTCL1PPCAC_25242, partial [Pristionchus entomophagus]
LASSLIISLVSSASSMSDSEDVQVLCARPSPRDGGTMDGSWLQVPASTRKPPIRPSKNRRMNSSSSGSSNASSVLLTSMIDTARREAASEKRLDARRKVNGVSGAAKRPRIETNNGKAAIDVITLDDKEEIEKVTEDKEETKVEKKVDGIMKEEKKCTNVTGSVVTAAAILAPRSPNKTASQGSRVSSICDAETQENDNSSQEARAAFVRELMSVDDGRARLRDGDVVRNRADRAAMHGQDCPCCSAYYDQLGMDDEERRRRIDQVSRHRYVARPMPATPPHYWDIDFPTEEEQEARGMISRRVEERVDHSNDERKGEIKDQDKGKGKIKDQEEGEVDDLPDTVEF